MQCGREAPVRTISGASLFSHLTYGTTILIQQLDTVYLTIKELISFVTLTLVVAAAVAK